MIPVTKPFMPPRPALDGYYDGIFKRQWLTNNGPLLRELESSIPSHLGSREMSFVSNGTIALQMAIRSLEITGEVVTTPFSYIATTTSIIWEHCSPRFVDIENEGFNIDPQLIENAITEETTAILATHCFGISCDIQAIQDIATKHNLKVIYDASHCFGSAYKGQSIFDFGDVSTCSFHATKLFHSVEGGGVFANHKLLHEVNLMRNFGHDGPERFTGVGINGKNSEFHAAMGLCVLPHMNDILSQRRAINTTYFEQLNHVASVTLVDPSLEGWNWAYCPALFASETLCLKVKAVLERHDIHPRRYFYPSLETIHGNPKDVCPRSRSVASRILCLPSYHDLRLEDIMKICLHIREACAT
jgi:dTDP-4-amino-4,6-dideoxygalactose transaminase